MKLLFEGKDITNDVSIDACYHDMYSDGRSDSLVIKFDDIDRVWDAWKPATDNIVAVEEGPARTGKMFIHNIEPENGKYILTALAVPTNYADARSKSWEQVRLFQIGKEIAERYGFIFQQYGALDQTFPYLMQQEDDFSFLQKICDLAGCKFLVFNGMLIFYSMSYIEKQDPAYELILKPDTRFEWECTKSGKVGVIWSDLIPELAACSVVNLRTNGYSNWDGPVFIYHIRHDYIKRKSKIFFRKI